MTGENPPSASKSHVYLQGSPAPPETALQLRIDVRDALNTPIITLAASDFVFNLGGKTGTITWSNFYNQGDGNYTWDATDTDAESVNITTTIADITLDDVVTGVWTNEDNTWDKYQEYGKIGTEIGVVTITDAGTTTSLDWSGSMKLMKAMEGLWATFTYLDESNRYLIQYAYSLDEGLTWTTGNVCYDVAYDQRYPSIGVDRARLVHFAWTGKNSGSTSYTQARYRSLNISTMTLGTLYNVSSETSNVIYAIAVCDQDNGAHIIWIAANILKHQYTLNQGASWLGVSSITATNPIVTPTLYISPDNILHLAYVDPTAKALYYARSLDRGATWSSPVCLCATTYIPYNPCIGMGNDGIAYLVWQQRISAGNAYQQIHLRMSLDNGVTWQTETQCSSPITTDANYDQEYPTIACDPAINGMHLFWDSNSAAYGVKNIRHVTYDHGLIGSMEWVTTGTVNDWTRPIPLRQLTPFEAPWNGYVFLWQSWTTIKFYYNVDDCWLPPDGDYLLYPTSDRTQAVPVPYPTSATITSTEEIKRCYYTDNTSTSRDEGKEGDTITLGGIFYDDDLVGLLEDLEGQEVAILGMSDNNLDGIYLISDFRVQRGPGSEGQWPYTLTLEAVE